MKEFSDVRKRSYYKIQFIRRNERYQNFYKHVSKICTSPWVNYDINRVAKKHPEISESLKTALEFRPLNLKELLSIERDYSAGKDVIYENLLPSTAIIFEGKGKKKFKHEIYDLYAEKDPKLIDFVLQARRRFHRDRYDFNRALFLSIDAIDRKEKTIKIKIHLDRKIEDIIDDVKFLLKVLDSEAKYFRIDLKRPKPHWDAYDKLLKVYDLRREKKIWREIASQVYPGDVSIASSMRKVRHLYKQAEKMIKGGWKQI
jgi:hypothetical protein